MKIRFKKKRLYSNLFIGTVWATLGLFTLIYDKQIRWMDYGSILMSILYLGQFAYEYQNQYLTIENGTIRKNRFFGKKIALNKITWAKKFSGDLILKTYAQELTINTQLIDEKSMEDLTNILYGLKLPPEKNPFAKKP